MHLKGLVMHFQEMVLFIMLWLTVRRYYSFKPKNFVKFLQSQHFFDILIANTSWTLAKTPINHVIFWMSVMRIFRCIYVNYFNGLRFLAKINTKFQKMQILRQFKDHNSGCKYGNSTNDSIFLSAFSTLSFCNIHFCIWK